MLKILTIIGARPQIIKAAALSRVLKSKFKGQIKEIILHTGQHYDANMSDDLVSELQLPPPDYSLGVGSMPHALQLARMMEGIDPLLKKENPDVVIVYGDTNSTLAGALAAAKGNIPVAHVEAGMRSFNKIMPEETNRILTDHVSTFLFCPTPNAVENLLREGFTANAPPPCSPDHPRVVDCGDIMYDNHLYYCDIANGQSSIIRSLNLEHSRYALATIHRDFNTDRPERLTALFEALLYISSKHDTKIIFPIHPRTRKMMDTGLNPELLQKIRQEGRLMLLPPLSFFDMQALEYHSVIIMTDSGGLQKEAYFHKKPCIIFRAETEWTEIVEKGCGILADANSRLIIDAFEYFSGTSVSEFPSFFGEGRAAENICIELLDNLK